MSARGVASEQEPVGATALALLPLAAMLALVVALPLALIFRQSLEPNALNPSAAHDTFGNYATLLSVPTYQRALLRTIRLSVLATAVSLVLGVGATIALTAFHHHHWRRAPTSTVVILLITPVLAGPIVLVIGWLNLLSLGGLGYGLVNAVRALLGLETGRVVQTETGTLIGLVQFLTPFVVLVAYPVLRRIPTELYDAALALGDHPLTAVRRVVLPIAMPAVLAAGVVALALSVAAFVTPQFLGGDRNLVMSTLIAQLLGSFNPTLAAAAAVVLATVGLALMVAYGRLVARLERLRVTP